MTAAVRQTIWGACVLAAVVALLAQPAPASVRSHAFYARGLLAFNGSQWDQAFRLFDQAVRADASDAVAWYYRGLTQARRNQPAAAVQDIEHALKLAPTLARAALDLGIAYFDGGQYAAAKPWLQQARQQGTAPFTAAYFLGVTFYRLGDDAGALTYLEEAKADPELRPSAQYYAGLVLARQGKTTEARAEFAQTARAQPQSEIGKAAQRYATGAEVREPPAVGAKAPEKPWSLSAALGFQYDTNVKVAPSDSNLKAAGDIKHRGDGRAVIAARGQYTLLDTDLGRLRAAYDFFQSVHMRLTEFDLQGHRVRLDFASRPGTVSYGVSGVYDFYLLDYQSFFHEALATPWVAYAESEETATQLYYTVRGRDFLRKPYDPFRDGVNHALGLRQYVELGAAQRVLSVGYQFDKEDTISDGPGGRDFKYDGQQLDIDVAVPILDQLHAEAAYLFRLEDYRFPNSRPNRDGSQVRRHDNEHRFVLALAYELTANLAVTLDYMGVINGSNLPAFDYDRNIVSGGVRVMF